jgi:hypothetical protein
MKRVMLICFTQFSIHCSQWDPAVCYICLALLLICLMKLNIKISRSLGIMNLALKLCPLYWLDINMSAWVLWYLDIMLSLTLLIWLLYLGSVTAGGLCSLSRIFPKRFLHSCACILYGCSEYSYCYSINRIIFIIIYWKLLITVRS